MIRGITIRISLLAVSCALAVFALVVSTILFAPHDLAGASARDRAPRTQEGGAYQHLVLKHAQANGLPVELVHRVVMRESRYNPRAVSKGNYGIMQIRLGTARAMGYRGSAEGLLDADTNMTYAVKYLAGAYRAAGGNHDRAVMNYARGYYHAAKRQGFSPYATETGAAARGSYASAGAPADRPAASDVTTAREDAPH
jgi:soluble lytic murein transglycosylase-like protein